MIKVHKNGLFNTGFKNSRNNHEIFELHKYRYKNLRSIYFRYYNFKMRDLCLNKDNPSTVVFHNTIINNNHLFEIDHNIIIADIDDLTYFDNEEEY